MLKMYQHSRLQQFVKRSAEKKSKWLKSLFVLFLTLNATFGFNFGFTKHFNKRIQVLFYLLSALAFFVWTFIKLYPLITNDEFIIGKINHIIEVLQYLSFFFIINLTKPNFYDFVKIINQSFGYIEELNKESLGIKASVYVVAFSLILDLFNYVIWYKILHFVRTNENQTEVLSGFLNLGLDGVAVMRILITYYTYCITKKFNQIAGQTEMRTTTLMNFYFKLADSYDYTKQLNDRLIVALVLFEVPKMLMRVWAVLKLIQLKYGVSIYIGNAIYAFNQFTRLTVPCIIVEMIQAQVESARLRLHHRMLQETGTEKMEIRELLEYMSVRRLQHKAWGVIPLDMQLPLAVLSTCVTYIIVVVQFTHMYD